MIFKKIEKAVERASSASNFKTQRRLDKFDARLDWMADRIEQNHEYVKNSTKLLRHLSDDLVLLEQRLIRLEAILSEHERDKV